MSHGGGMSHGGMNHGGHSGSLQGGYSGGRQYGGYSGSGLSIRIGSPYGGGIGYSSGYGSLSGLGGFGPGYSSYGRSSYGRSSYGYGLGYSPYSSYGGLYGSYAPYNAAPYYSARPSLNYYSRVPAYSYPVPRVVIVPSYSSQLSAGQHYSAQSPPVAGPGSDLRPGMVLPDGAVVVSVEPIK